MIWFLEAIENWQPWYDKANSFVISAKNENDARSIASNNSGDEGEAVWLDAKKTSCRRLLNNEKDSLICRDYHAA